MSKHFLCFGCWNNGLCNKEEPHNPISNVMRKLHENVDENTEFISILGDNYYAESMEKKDSKKIKQKLIDRVKLKSGFDCLPKEKPIYMILGNHDLDTSSEDKKFFIGDENVPESGCYTIENENEAVNDNISYVLTKSFLFGNCLVIMMDTTMYNDAIDVKNSLVCYAKFLNVKSITIDELRQMQEKFILESLETHDGKYENIIWMGHHPIAGVKQKEKSGKKKQKNFEGFGPMIQTLITIHKKIAENEKKIRHYYVCADIHLFQSGVIEIYYKNGDSPIKIDQYISGTGGASLDDAVDGNFEFQSDENTKVTYKTTQNICKNGFVRCTIVDNVPEFEFIEIETTVGGGKTRKNRRRKLRRARKSRKPSRRN